MLTLGLPSGWPGPLGSPKRRQEGKRRLLGSQKGEQLDPASSSLNQGIQGASLGPPELDLGPRSRGRVAGREATDRAAAAELRFERQRPP